MRLSWILLLSALTLASCAEEEKKGDEDSSNDSGETTEHAETESASNYTWRDYRILNYYDDGKSEGYATPDENAVFGTKRFDRAMPFVEGMARVANKNADGEYVYAFIDSTGEEVTEYAFVEAGDFSSGMAWVRLEEDGKVGYIDVSGELVLQPVFEEEFNFSDGLLLLCSGDYSDDFSFHMSYYGDAQFGYMNTQGDTVIPIQFAWATTFSDGVAAVSTKGLGDYGFGYIKPDGSFLIEPQYLYGGPFSQGEAPVVDKSEMLGFINKDAEFVIQPQYDNYKYMYDYLFSEFLKERNITYSTEDGLYIVSKNEKWGIIDREENEILPFTYDEIGIPENGLVEVQMIKKEEEYSVDYYTGLFNLELRKEVVPAKYDELDTFYDEESDWIAVGLKTDDEAYSADLWGYANVKTGFIIDPAYDDVEDFSEGRAAVEKDEKWGYVNEKGELVTPIKYDFYDEFQDGQAYVKLGDDYLYIDKNGKEIDD